MLPCILQLQSHHGTSKDRLLVSDQRSFSQQVAWGPPRLTAFLLKSFFIMSNQVVSCLWASVLWVLVVVVVCFVVLGFFLLQLGFVSGCAGRSLWL